MTTKKRIQAFIAKVETNKHDEAIEEFYTENASMQENNSKPRKGRKNLVKYERGIMSKTKSIVSKCIRPVFISGNHVVIRWQFCFEWLNGTVSEIEELAYQRWEGDFIAEEKFFYDPSQFQPK